MDELVWESVPEETPEQREYEVQFGVASRCPSFSEPKAWDAKPQRRKLKRRTPPELMVEGRGLTPCPRRSVYVRRWLLGYSR